MFVPLNDANPLKNIRRPWVTWGLIALNVAVFLWQSGLAETGLRSVILGGGMIPGVLFGVHQVPEAVLPGTVTLVSYQFLHGDFWHLAGNMLFLYIFGDNIEDATGHKRFLPFYIVCGMAAGLAHAMALPGSAQPLIGASGATSGLVGAYLLLHPRVWFWVLAFGRIPLKLPAIVVIGLWLVWQVVFLFTGQDQSVAWIAHLGGFAAGLVLIMLVRKSNIALLDRDIEDAPSVVPSIGKRG